MKKLLSLAALAVAICATFCFSSCIKDTTPDEGLYYVTFGFSSYGMHFEGTDQHASENFESALAQPYLTAIESALGAKFSGWTLQTTGSTTKFDKAVKQACANAESQAAAVTTTGTGTITVNISRSANPGTESLYSKTFTY